MRVVAFDVGSKRTGVAVSDASGILARPYARLLGDAAPQAIALVERLASDEDGVSTVVVGLPRTLDGRDNAQTERARAFADRLRRRLAIDVVMQDERLTSVEAERLLAEREPDWRRRKDKVDAAAAAIILQDYLDHLRAGTGGPPDAHADKSTAC